MSKLHRIQGKHQASPRVDVVADVVFIHGLGGHYLTTWRHAKGDDSSWPHWLAEEFPQVRVWSLEYAASPSTWLRLLGWFSRRWRDAGHSMALPDRAAQVLELMRLEGLGTQPLVFVCHSLGGLVAKHIIRKSADGTAPQSGRVCQRTKAVLFLGTPHQGAELATMAKAFRSVFGATVSIDDLRAHHAGLRELHDWYQANSAGLGIKTRAFFETRPVAAGVTVVNPTTANPGVGGPPIGLDEDHLSLAKPRERRALVCLTVSELIGELIRDGALPTGPVAPPAVEPGVTANPYQVVGQPPPVIVQVAPAPAPSRAIPCELPPRAGKFFGRQAERDDLAARLRRRENVAVVGPAGMGKTALAAEAVRNVVGETTASVAASPYPDGVVYLNLYTSRGQAEEIWHTLANLLAGSEFRETRPARERAREACQGREALLIVEGGEEADGQGGRARIVELLSVLSSQNRWLLLTRRDDQAEARQTICLDKPLPAAGAGELLDSLAQGRVTGQVRDDILEILAGHPLALTWAGNLLARPEEDPASLAAEWLQAGLPNLSDPQNLEHGLAWLFGRSTRGLSAEARQVLGAAGLLAPTPFPRKAMAALLVDTPGRDPAADVLRELARAGLIRRAAATKSADEWEFTHVLGYQAARRQGQNDGTARERLAGWLGEQLTQAIALTGSPALFDRVGALTEHSRAVLRTDPELRLCIPLANVLLYEVLDRLIAWGRLDLFRLGLEGVQAWLDGAPREVSEMPDWQREQGVLHNRSGDVLRAQGQLDKALDAYQASMAISEKLAQADRSNTQWQRDLSYVLTGLAQWHEGLGQPARALPLAAESLAIDERLAALDPTNVTWADDVKVSRALVERLRNKL